MRITTVNKKNYYMGQEINLKSLFASEYDRKYFVKTFNASDIDDFKTRFAYAKAMTMKNIFANQCKYKKYTLYEFSK